MEALPTIILAGSDRRPVALARAGRDHHPLSGYKGADVRIDGRALVDVVIERLRQCGREFGPLYLAGPAAVYGEHRDGATVIDTDGSFGANIRVSLEHVRRLHPGRPVAFTSCDILPTPESLRELMEDYREGEPCDLWFPLIRAPEDPQRLGASAWKPKYRIAPAPGEPAVEVLPGHLLVADPAALRLFFLYRLFGLGYRTRNRSISYRRRVLVRGVILELLVQDLLHVLGLRAPTLTWSVLRAGLPAARLLREGRADRTLLEHALRRIFVKSRHRRRFPDRRVRLPLREGLSLALDIDTEEEARQFGGEVRRQCS